MIKTIEDNNIVYAKIIKASYEAKDCEFYTEKEDEIQFGIVNFKKGFKTGAHFHNHNEDSKNQTDEILILEAGSIRIDFYNDKGAYFKSCEAKQGDIVILYKGGHNIVFNEDTKTIIIKPGPYIENNNNTRIIGANNLELIIDKD